MSGVIQENKQWHRTRHTLLSTRTFLTLYLRIHIYLEREQVSPNYNLFQLCVQKIERVEFYVRKMFRSLLNRFLEYGYTVKPLLADTSIKRTLPLSGQIFWNQTVAYFFTCKTNSANRTL